MPDRGNPENPKQKPFRLGSGPRVAPPPDRSGAGQAAGYRACPG